MNLVFEDPDFHSGVFFHDLSCLLDIGAKYHQASNLDLVGDRADDTQSAFLSQHRISAAVLSHNLVCVWLVSLFSSKKQGLSCNSE